MAKTIETLKKPFSKEDVLHRHIADTYFYQKARTKTHRKKTVPIMNNLTWIAVWIFGSAVSLIVAIAVISFLNNRYLESVKREVANAPVVKIVDGGTVNRSIIKSFTFRGYAKNPDSRITKDAVILSNPKKYRWADLSVDLKFPLDLSKRRLAISLRGKTGGESVNVVLRDVNNKSLRLPGLSLASGWTDETIALNGARNEIDLSNINHLRIEYGYVGESSKEADSPINVTVYLRNISLLKET